MDQELEKYLFTAGIDGRWATAAWIEIDGFIESGDVALLFQQYQNPPLGLS